ncbi:MAG: response regulator [SAR324 cluster bacterium]|nr:response regulator [SAR324 cluster bacterium]
MAVRIMIVEDEALIAMDLKNQLRQLGYKVEPVMSSGEEALKNIKKNPPDLLLSDISLSTGMDGIELMKQIRKFSDLPILFLTAHTREYINNKCGKNIADGCLFKPLRRGLLGQTIEEIFSNREKKVKG